MLPARTRYDYLLAENARRDIHRAILALKNDTMQLTKRVPR
jgi:hypothetical protein